MEAKILFFSRPCNNPIWQYKSIPISEAYLGSAKPFSPSPRSSEEYLWNTLESLIDELNTLCVEGWKLHQLEEPRALHLNNVYDGHYFTKAILTRKLEPSTTTSSDAVAGGSDSDLKLDDEASEKTV